MTTLTWLFFGMTLFLGLLGGHWLTKKFFKRVIKRLIAIGDHYGCDTAYWNKAKVKYCSKKDIA